MSLTSVVADSLVDYQSTVWGVMFLDPKKGFVHDNALWISKTPLKHVGDHSLIQQKIKSIQIVDTVLDSPLSSGDVCVIEFDQLTLEEASAYFDPENININPPIIKVVAGRWTKFLAYAHGNFKSMFYGVLQNSNWCYKEDGIYLKAVFKNYVWDILEEETLSYNYSEYQDKSLKEILTNVLTSGRLGKLFKEEDLIFNVVVEKEKRVIRDINFDLAKPSITGSITGTPTYLTIKSDEKLETVTMSIEESEEFSKLKYDGRYNHLFDKSLKCFLGYLARDFGCIVTMIGGNLYFGKRTMDVPASKVFVYGFITKDAIADLTTESGVSLSASDMRDITLFDNSFESITVDYKPGNTRATDMAFSFDAAPKVTKIKAAETDIQNRNYKEPFLVLGRSRFWHELVRSGEDMYTVYLKQDTGETFSLGTVSGSIATNKNKLLEYAQSKQSEYADIKDKIKEEKNNRVYWRKSYPRGSVRDIEERMGLQRADVIDRTKRVTVRGARGDPHYYIPKPFIIVGVNKKHSTRYSPVQIVHTIDSNGYKMDITGVAQLGYTPKGWSRVLPPPILPFKNKTPVPKGPVATVTAGIEEEPRKVYPNDWDMGIVTEGAETPNEIIDPFGAITPYD